MAQWTFGRKVGLGFALAGVIAGGIAAVGYRTTGALIDDTASLAHSHEVRREGDRKSTRLNSSHIQKSRMPSSA